MINSFKFNLIQKIKIYLKSLENLSVENLKLYQFKLKQTGFKLLSWLKRFNFNEFLRLFFKNTFDQFYQYLYLLIEEGLLDELSPGRPETPWNIRDGTRLQNLPEQTRKMT